MINKQKICDFGLTYLGEYQFDDSHSSFVFKRDNICFIIDDNICENKNKVIFDYSKYCEMQNKYVAEFEKVYRVNIVVDNDYLKIGEWLNKKPTDIEIEDAEKYFSIIGTPKVIEAEMLRYSKPKKLLEIEVEK